MNKGTIILIVSILMGGSILLADKLTDWSLVWKLAPAGAFLVIGLLAFIGSGPSSTTTTPTPATTPPTTTDRTSPAEVIVTTIFVFALIGGLVWFVANKIVPALWNTPNAAWVQDLQETRIVNNGFHRHDAPYPPLITPTPFNQIVEAGVVYEAFEIEAGDYFRLYFDRPVDLRIEGEEDSIFTRHTDPIRYEATQTGIIQVRSETGQNHVRITFSN